MWLIAYFVTVPFMSQEGEGVGEGNGDGNGELGWVRRTHVSLVSFVSFYFTNFQMCGTVWTIQDKQKKEPKKTKPKDKGKEMKKKLGVNFPLPTS